MPALQVRDFPQDLYDGLKARSENERRSMSQQVVVAVEQMLGSAECRKKPDAVFASAVKPDIDSYERMQKRIESRKRIFEKLKGLNLDVLGSLPDPTTLISEERDERESSICSSTFGCDPGDR